MRTTFTAVSILIALINFETIGAQAIHQFSFSNTNFGKQFVENDADHPCITSQEYEAIEKDAVENCSRLGIGSHSSGNRMITQLNWPLRAAAGFTDCSYYVISNYLDQDTTVGVLRDYNCGTNTYDGHRGTDIISWPFPFYKLDNSQVEVIAAAPGTIISRSDGNFDRNCATNSLTANYILLQHADGSRVLYWHMKQGSVTSKLVGATVTTGEYLGVVGSSGNSTAPHLHFEVWNGSTSANVINPYSGSCNSLNANSWWVTQKEYREPAVIKASVHTTDIIVPGCPTTETPNESTTYQIPFQGTGLPAGSAKFYVFFRNETLGMTADVSILNPNGTTFNSWTYTGSTNYEASYRSWTKTLPAVPGTYTFKAVYNGQTCSQTFEVTDVTTATSELYNNVSVNIFPNPSNGKFIVETTIQENARIEFYNLLGEIISSIGITSTKTEVELYTASGMYFYKLFNHAQLIATGKVEIQ
jgi:hypothetical protein